MFFEPETSTGYIIGKPVTSVEIDSDLLSNECMAYRAG
ncbi:hypothetical protein EGR_10700 [Echinococcus granulosus]|uniref:Uncharacterized protein n=1 Tax=Echinococcus granulosus TaxID=6210 RepID=W6U7U8_ECHGR|nr:hypothetical protein EGR_10700 [Echinococcus granulosus]EUB54437.1 hypothetical protein EGR_10700 [Echinococcus granulosus]